MNLKLLSVKSEFNKRYCGVCLYLLNSAIHCCSVKGGNAPVITSHSVIERPEPVKRVIPPKIICTMIMNTPISNHIATGLEERYFCMAAKVKQPCFVLLNYKI